MNTREIKFRVRDAETKEVIGYERVNNNGHWEYQRLNRKEWLLGIISDHSGIENQIREQYTGLKDKNKAEVYDGDLVDTGTYYGISEVVFSKGSFKIKTNYDLLGMKPNRTPKTVGFGSWAKQVEIVGSILTPNINNQK